MSSFLHSDAMGLDAFCKNTTSYQHKQEIAHATSYASESTLCPEHINVSKYFDDHHRFEGMLKIRREMSMERV